MPPNTHKTPHPILAKHKQLKGGSLPLRGYVLQACGPVRAYATTPSAGAAPPQRPPREAIRNIVNPFWIDLRLSSKNDKIMKLKNRPR